MNKIKYFLLGAILLSVFACTDEVTNPTLEKQKTVSTEQGDPPLLFQQYSEWAKLKGTEKPKNIDGNPDKEPKESLKKNNPNEKDGIAATYNQYYYFGYQNGYVSNISGMTISPAIYSYYYYAYQWQPVSFEFPTPAVSASIQVWGYVYILAYDENGAYLGYGYGGGYWGYATYTAPQGRKIGHVVVYNAYNAYDYWYTYYMAVTYASNDAPVANAGEDQTFDCVIGNQDVTFDGSGSTDPDGDALTYNWSGTFGTLSGVNPTLSLEAGVYSVTLTVTDPDGLSSSDEVVITVNTDLTAPIIMDPSDLTVFANTNGGFTGSIGTATVSDECDGNPSLTNDALAIFPLGNTTVTYTATDASGNIATATQVVTVKRFPINIDVKPGDNNNTVNLKSKGVTPIAVLTDGNFDATTLDVSSLRFGLGAAFESHGKGHIEDVDGDGDNDLILHFDTQVVGLSVGDNQVCLTGTTNGGIPVEGCDLIIGKSNGK